MNDRNPDHAVFHAVLTGIIQQVIDHLRYIILIGRNIHDILLKRNIHTQVFLFNAAFKLQNIQPYHFTVSKFVGW